MCTIDLCEKEKQVSTCLEKEKQLHNELKEMIDD